MVSGQTVMYVRVVKHNVWIVDPVVRKTDGTDSSMIIWIPDQIRVIPHLENKRHYILMLLRTVIWPLALEGGGELCICVLTYLI